MFDFTIKTEVLTMNRLSSHILMVRPHRFRMNDQTATTNFYQKGFADWTSERIAKQAQQEFDAFVLLLRSEGIKVTVHQDNPEPDTPDALFPNNWVSFHDQHRAILYPMYAKNRRKERTPAIFETLKNDGVEIFVEKDYSNYENKAQFLEGTGSMVLDRVHKKAYAALSERTDRALFFRFCLDMGYDPIYFNANQTVEGKRLPIYHTNVMMSVGTTFALVGLTSIDILEQRELLTAQLLESGKEIIPLSEGQLSQFAGNMLLLQGAKSPLLVMSSTAYRSLTPQQLSTLEQHAKIIHSPLDTIERGGGGSARCMMAEVF